MTPDEQPPVLDDEKIGDLRSLLGDGPDGVDGLVDTFTDRMPEVLAELGEAAEAGDVEQVGNLAHKVKGEASTLGARRLSALAETIEKAARAEELEDPAGAVEELATVYEETESAFEERGAG